MVDIKRKHATTHRMDTRFLCRPLGDRFVGESCPPPEPRIVDLPPNCIEVTNVVSQAVLTSPIDGTRIMRRYPFCRRDSKRWRAVSISTIRPKGSVGVYDDGRVTLTGVRSARGSRYVLDRVVSFLRGAGYPELAVNRFRVVNSSLTFRFGGTLDVEAYKTHARPDLVYLPDGFVGARRRFGRTHTLVTLFQKTGTAMGGTADLRSQCLDVVAVLDEIEPFLVTSKEETEVVMERAKKRRKKIQ